MKKRFVITSINYTKKTVVMSEVIRATTKAKGEDVEFQSKTVRYESLKDNDFIGKVYTLSESFN